MARVRVMYWKEIPVQVQAHDEAGVVSKLLDNRFQQAVDAVAMFDGSAGSDAYLSAWEWGEYKAESGSAREAAERVSARYDEQFPRDIIGVIRSAVKAERRNPMAGTLDHLMG